MNKLGLLLSNGAEGVDRNAARAKELEERAIDKADHAEAMSNLGNLLSKGEARAYCRLPFVGSHAY